MKTTAHLSAIFILVLIFTAGIFLVTSAENVNLDPVFGPKTIIINKVKSSDVLGNLYGEVLFRHKYHAQIVKDCTVCHHHFEKHYNDQIVPADKCDSCHASEKFDSMSRNFACDVCHDPDASPDVRNVITDEGVMMMIPGLKAAYHRSCIDCHNNMGGPTGCGECHLPNVPDHAKLIDSYDGSGTCEECHKGKIEELQNTTHYKLSNGYDSEYLSGDPESELESEVGMINRPGRLWGILADDAWDAEFSGACKTCHIGYGLKPLAEGSERIFRESEFGNIDCLICHVTEGYSLSNTERLNKNFAALTPLMENINHTSTEACKRCHLALTSIKPALSVSPVYSNLRGTAFEPATDIHAALGLSCFDCHYDRDHIFRRQISSSLQAADAPDMEQGCVRCHRDAHINDDYTKMASFMACTGCHVPDNGGPIEINLDIANKDVPMEMKSKVVYKWFNRTTDIYGNPYGDKGDGMLFPYRMAVIREPVNGDGNPLSVDPVTGAVLGEVDKWRERAVYLPMSHGVSLKDAYTCNVCHGEESKFDWPAMDLDVEIIE
ncbi:hypothetical protein J7L05_01425 [bacterium]|nr:hypothetical protein [bacterium]